MFSDYAPDVASTDPAPRPAESGSNGPTYDAAADAASIVNQGAAFRSAAFDVCIIPGACVYSVEDVSDRPKSLSCGFQRGSCTLAGRRIYCG